MQANNIRHYRWAVYCCLAAAYFLSFFHRFSLGILRETLVGGLGMSATQFGMLAGMYFYAYTAMQVPAGLLADSAGPRAVASAGCLVSAVGSLLFALSPGLVGIFVGRFLIGLGVSVIYVCTLKVISQWFAEERFGAMVGLTGFLGNMGGVAAEAPFAAVIAVVSWRYVYIAAGLVSFIVGVVTFIIVRDSPEKARLGHPGALISRVQAPEHEGATSLGKGVARVLTNLTNWNVFLILAAYTGVYYTFAGAWGTGYLSTVFHIGDLQASECATLLVMGIAVGYLLAGAVSDRMRSRKKPLVVMGAVVNLIWLALVWGKGEWLGHLVLGPLMFVLGVSTACYSLCFSLAKELNDPGYTGVAVAVVNLGAFLGGAVVPALVGHILDLYRGALAGAELYRRGFAVLLLINLLGLVASLLVRETHGRNVSQA